MKLHWSPKSPYVRKVLVCAHELGMVEQLELVRSVVAMVRPNDRLMQDNPLSKIPTLVLDDGTSLFDSVVICEYLNESAAGSLFPPTGPAKWRALRWHAFANGLLDALILWRNERDRSDAQRSSEMLDAFEVKTLASLRQLEEEVATLEEEPFSIAHITVGCALGYLDFRFEHLNWRSRAPRLAQWQAGIAARPSFTATAPTSNE